MFACQMELVVLHARFAAIQDMAVGNTSPTKLLNAAHQICVCGLWESTGAGSMQLYLIVMGGGGDPSLSLTAAVSGHLNGTTMFST